MAAKKKTAKKNIKKSVRVGVDLDGVVAKHAMGGFWVYLRKLKESLLKQTSLSNYYYPATKIEKLMWRIINSRRRPFDVKGRNLKSFMKKNRMEFYLITSRFKFLENLTYLWLKRFGLDQLFKKVLINLENQNPLVFKLGALNKLKLDCLIDDDLEVIEYLKAKTSKKLFWVNIHYAPWSRRDLKHAIVCKDFIQALDKVEKHFSKK